MLALVYSARVTLLLVLSTAAISKVRHPSAFRAFEDASGRLVSERPLIKQTVAVATPAIEGAGAVLLAVNRFAVFGLALAFVLAVAFLLVVAHAVRNERAVPCNCFGSDGGTISMTHVTRNAFLVGISALGLGIGVAWPIPSLIPEGSFVLEAVLGVAAASLFVRWDDVSFLVTGDTG